MKEEILKRAMFAMPLSKEAQNTGILSGFDMEEELDEDENADLEEMPPMARTPQNPEILMNNLRGDVRSLDARYMELAQMVGEEAAMETPPEVLAMLMGQMGAQQAGIGALPQAQGMMPPGAGMPPPDQMGAPQPAPAMPQGGIPMPQGMESAPPFSQGAEAPQGFAYGGEVGAPRIQGNGAVTGSGMLNMQVPISVGGGGAGGQTAAPMMAGMGGTSDNGYMTFPGARTGGFDPRAIQADPQGFAQHMAQMQQREQQVPGSTMLGSNMEAGMGGINGRFGFAAGNNSMTTADARGLGGGLGAQLGLPRFGQQLGAGITRAMQGPPNTNRGMMFAEGGEVAPPTPDGMPPMQAAVGAFVTPAMRAAQFLGDKASQYGASANAFLGRMFMPPSMTQPFLENVRGPGGRYTAEQIQRGGDLIYPTFTQGLAQGVDRLAAQYPRLAALAGPAIGVGAGASYVSGKGGPGGGGMGSELADMIPRDTREELVARGNRPVSMTLDMTTGMQQRPGQPAEPIPFRAPAVAAAAATPGAAAPGTTEEAPVEQGDRLGDFITEKLAAFDKRQAAKEAAPAQKTKMQRIKEAAEEYAPLYEEILGGDKEAAKMNALLLLSEAGLKLAGTARPTAAMAIAEAFSGVPRGFAAIAAQERELGVKAKIGALERAISDVDAQDKYAQAMQLEILKGDMKILQEQAKKGGVIIEDGGLGLRISKDKNGSFVGTGISESDPAVKSAISSRYTLRDTDNPFVENRGQAPTTIETDKSERIKLGNTLRSLDNSLATLSNLKGVYVSAYGPGAWFSDKVNNLLVPIDPTGAIKPNFDTADAATRVSTGMNSILKNIASANDSGRVAVQEQEWARETAKGISNPTAFFSDKELAAKQFNSMEAMLRNARQQVLTQLGLEGNDYVMRTPNTGTQNDPFSVPSDPDQQKILYTFLGSTIGKVQDPRALVYLRMPNGTVSPFTPTQLRSLIQ